MDAKQLQEILQVCKDFGLTSVKLKTNELELECSFPGQPIKQVSTPNILTQKPTFPEARYHQAIQSEVTAAELNELGFVGVAPKQKQVKKD
jgi:hypothetical protein